jgi:large subunit ribosomal protein L21
MHAILEDRNQQYRVAEGDRVLIAFNRELEQGSMVQFDKVCAITGDTPQVGEPYVEGASVTAKVICAEVKGPKLVVQKFKRRKNYRRRTGFRARFTEVRIESIQGS